MYWSMLIAKIFVTLEYIQVPAVPTAFDTNRRKKLTQYLFCGWAIQSHPFRID